jgi:hypothetical protein
MVSCVSHNAINVVARRIGGSETVERTTRRGKREPHKGLPPSSAEEKKARRNLRQITCMRGSPKPTSGT